MIVVDKAKNSKDLIDIINLGPTNNSNQQKPISVLVYSFVLLILSGRERTNSNYDSYTHNSARDILKDL